MFNNLFFDDQDRILLTMVNAMLKRKSSSRNITTLFASHLHPRGIKEIADSREIRVAYAVIKLLNSLEVGKASDRIRALRTLRDEVLYCVENQSFARNTARVLLEIMKHLIRLESNEMEQLKLANDFRKAMTGRPSLIRRLLERYHLLEMPEEWNQVSFDNHVHDANTEGRKTSTHLIMDAWIKGIRSLTVIYYNYIASHAAKELMEAAAIMEIDLSIGIELRATFRGKQVQFIWTPSGLDSADEFLRFLSKQNVAEFFQKRKSVTAYQQRRVIRLLKIFNTKYIDTLKEQYDLHLEPLRLEDFVAFVGEGQMSVLHLSEFIHSKLMPALSEKAGQLREAYKKAEKSSRQQIVAAMAKLNKLDSEEIFHLFIRGELGNIDTWEDEDRIEAPPEIIRMSPVELLESLHRLRAGNKITLSITNLDALDTIELLYEGKGLITHIEVYNHKDFIKGKTANYADIIELKRVINTGSIIGLKRFISGLLEKLSGDPSEEARARAEKFRDILYHMAEFQTFYRRRHLRIRVGSDSAGKGNAQHGMGFVVIPTVSKRVRRIIHKKWPLIPIRLKAKLIKVYEPTGENGGTHAWQTKSPLGRLMGYFGYGYHVTRMWQCNPTLESNWHHSNVAALGGRRERGNHFHLEEEHPDQAFNIMNIKYLKTGIRNMLKILTGFVPAFLTFYLTKDWWVLAYLGAPIWFAITGVRNILQSVLGGGGFTSTPLLRWKDYVNWRRVADSLLFTGFSVPLLDWFVKTILLDRAFGINTTTAPVATYAFIALANGIYLSSHNILRGFPKEAVIGNFFRSILSIPIAVFFNNTLAGIMGHLEISEVDDHLQKGAAIISKLASDTVAAIIEGTADRRRNIALRYADYNSKISQLFDSYDKMVLLFPDKDVLEMLKTPKEFVKALRTEKAELLTTAAYDSLDLLYFWMYQPYARKVLQSILKEMSEEERKIFVAFQSVLECYKPISKLFIKGLIGGNFSRTLSFYLDRSEIYLKELQKLTKAPS
jgi:hypothetical protein